MEVARNPWRENSDSEAFRTFRVEASDLSAWVFRLGIPPFPPSRLTERAFGFFVDARPMPAGCQAAPCHSVFRGMSLHKSRAAPSAARFPRKEARDDVPVCEALPWIRR